MKRFLKCILIITCLFLSACATKAGIREEFDRSVKAYNRLLRWHEHENAVMLYVDKDQQEASLKQAQGFKARGLSVTDFSMLTSQALTEKKTGEVVTEYDYYILPSNRIKTVTDRQHWVYQEEIKSWKIKSGLPLFE